MQASKSKNGLKIIYSVSLTIFGALAFVTSCAPKPAAVPGTKTFTAEYLAQGKTIFENSCGKCHDLPNPDDFSATEWVGLVNSMAPKANLNDKQHAMVYDYIISAKK